MPILEKHSKLKFNTDFFCGYSPERINPGNEYKLTNIIKVTSGSNSYVAKIIDDLYKQIIISGTYKAKSIKIAESAKIIENVQRDLNIALINELSILFNEMQIDTEEVLKAALTKWNFMNFKPGLVGGHCIGVDPYYLTYKAKSIGYDPKIILAGRSLNDQMGKYVIKKLVNKSCDKNIELKNSQILILGFSFKENCSDFRNTGVIKVINALEKYTSKIDVFDPWVDINEVKKSYKINIIKKPQKLKYDVIIIAVNHKNFKRIGVKEIRKFGKNKHILYDLKYLFNAKLTDLKGYKKCIQK